jgi:mono/diheme cytochrome c family protein
MASSTCALAEDVFPTHPVAGAHENYRNLFRLRCSSCHGANGEGTDHEFPHTGPALKGNPFVQHAPAEAIIKVIRLGRNGRERLYHEAYPNMPAFGAEAVFDADGLVNFLKTDLQR